MATDDRHGGSPPAARGALLAHLLEEEVDLDDAFDRLLRSREEDEEAVAMKAVVPGEALASGETTLAVLLASVLEEYEDIDQLIGGLREHDQAAILDRPLEDAVAVVSEAELADPEALSRALEPLHSERAKFEFLFDTAKRALDRLDVYRLSRKPSEELVKILRREEKLRTVQSLVGFLRSLNSAADSFEALDLPSPHIRDYLRHLYLMGDWSEMARLVSVLEVAVSQLFDVGVPLGDGQGEIEGR